MTGRRIIIGTLAVLSIATLSRLFSTPGRAQSVDDANKHLAKTEERLANEVGKSNQAATAVVTDLNTPERLPAELTEFGRTTQRLQTLSQDLSKDIASYETATTAKLGEFDNELKLIKDAGTRRHLERVRGKAQRQAAERLHAARSALDSLHLVLSQGTDLQHAAKSVQLADELQLHGNDLERQVQQAKDQATSYARLSNTLLAKLTTTTEKAE